MVIRGLGLAQRSPAKWENLTLTLKWPLGSRPWLSCQDCGSNLSLHRIKPTWEILPLHRPSRLLEISHLQNLTGCCTKFRS